MNSLDELPVGKGGWTPPPEYATDRIEEDASPSSVSLPLSSRLSSSSWKTRLEAYEEITIQLSESKSINILESNEILFKMIQDPNPVARCKGFQIVKQSITCSDFDPDQLLPSFFQLLPSTCFSHSMKRIKSESKQLVYDLTVRFPDHSLPLLLPYCTQKNAKIALCSLDIIHQMIDQHPQICSSNLDLLLSTVPELLNHANKDVRSGSVDVCAAMGRQFGEDGIAGLQSKVRSSHWKSIQEKLVSSTRSADLSPDTEEQRITSDVELSKEWKSLIVSKQWKERKQVVDELVALVESNQWKCVMIPDVLQALTRIVQEEINIMILGQTVLVLRALVDHTKPELVPFPELDPLFQSLFKLYKQIKPNLYEELDHLLDTLYRMYYNEEMTEHVWNLLLPHFRSKVVKITMSTLRFVQRRVDEQGTCLNPKLCTKVLSELSQHSHPEIRQLTFEVIARVAAAQGLNRWKSLCDAIETIDAQRLMRIESLCETYKKVKHVENKENQIEDERPVVVKRDEVVSAVVKETKLNQPSKQPKRIKQKEKITKANETEEPGTSENKRYTIRSNIQCKNDELVSYEDAIEQMTQWYGNGAFLTQLRSKQWKERVEGMETLQRRVAEQEITSDIVGPLVVLLSHSPGFKEPNFNVGTLMYATLNQVLRKTTVYSVRLFGVVSTGCLSKLSDLKMKQVIFEYLHETCRLLGPSVVLSHLEKKLQLQKNPKVYISYFEWVEQLVQRAPVQSLDLVRIVKQTHSSIEHANKKVRDQVVQVYVQLYRMFGALVKPQLVKNVKPAMVEQLEEKFATLSDHEIGAAMSPAEDTEESSETISLDTFLPRIDVKSQISSKVLKELNSTQWKDRKAGLDRVRDLVDQANDRIEPNCPELVKALRQRLQDPNKLLVASALKLLQRLPRAFGYSSGLVSKSCKSVLESTAPLLGDAKKQIAQYAQECYTEWMKCETPPNAVYSSVSKTLSNAPTSRLGVLKALLVIQTWTLEASEIVVASFFECLGDKQSPVRSAAEQILTNVYNGVGSGPLRSGLAHLTTTQRMTIAPMLDKIWQGESQESDEIVVPPLATTKKTETKQRRRTETKSKPSTRRGGEGGKRATQPKAKGRVPSEKKRATQPKVKCIGTEQARRIKKKSMSKHRIVGESTKEEQVEKTTPGPVIGSPSNALKLWYRRKRSPPLQYAYEEWTIDDIEELKEQFRVCVTTSYHTLLFSSQFQHHCQALDQLEQQLEEVYSTYPEVIPLFFAWIAYRWSEDKTQCVIKCLGVCEKLVALYQSTQRQLTDQEIVYLVPSILELLLGHNKSLIQQRAHVLFARLGEVGAIAKLSHCLRSGLQSSKNSKVKAACCRELTQLILKYSVEETGAEKCIKGVVRLLNKTRDHIERTCAVQLCVAMYERAEEKWVLVYGESSPTDATKQLLEMKFKKLKPKGTEGMMGKKREPHHPALSKPKVVEREEHSNDLIQRSTNETLGKSRSTKEHPPNFPETLFELDFEQLQRPKEDTLNRLDRLDTSTETPSFGKSDPSLSLSMLLEHVRNEREHGTRHEYLDMLAYRVHHRHCSSTELKSQCTTLLLLISDTIELALPVPLCRQLQQASAILNDLFTLYSSCFLTITKEALLHCFLQCIKVLCDPREEIPEPLRQTYNQTINCLLEKTPSTTCLCSLVYGFETISMSQTSSTLSILGACFLKVMKSLEIDSAHVNVAHLLQCVDQLYTVRPRTYWKRFEPVARGTSRDVASCSLRVLDTIDPVPEQEIEHVVRVPALITKFLKLLVQMRGGAIQEDMLRLGDEAHSPVRSMVNEIVSQQTSARETKDYFAEDDGERERSGGVVSSTVRQFKDRMEALKRKQKEGEERGRRVDLHEMRASVFGSTKLERIETQKSKSMSTTSAGSSALNDIRKRIEQLRKSSKEPTK